MGDLDGDTEALKFGRGLLDFIIGDGERDITVMVVMGIVTGLLIAGVAGSGTGLGANTDTSTLTGEILAGRGDGGV